MNVKVAEEKLELAVRKYVAIEDCLKKARIIIQQAELELNETIASNAELAQIASRCGISEESVEELGYFSVLPNEIATMILNYAITLNDSCSEVCSLFKNIIDEIPRLTGFTDIFSLPTAWDL